jgi:hypothetical protein
MCEEWDAHHDNEHGVAYGLEHTGRIVTAPALTARPVTEHEPTVALPLVTNTGRDETAQLDGAGRSWAIEPRCA